MRYFFSSSTNAFYPYELKYSYVESKSWPDDAIEVSTDIVKQFMGEPPAGKIRSSSVDGFPCWVDIPPPPHADLVAQADAQKTALQREAEDVIKPLDRAKSLGIATPEELALLIEWEKYSVYLMRVDTSTAPDIAWPQKP